MVGGVFKNLILSVVGLMSHGTADELKSWKEVMPEDVFMCMQRRISVQWSRQGHGYKYYGGGAERLSEGMLR